MPNTNSSFTKRCSHWFISDSASESLSEHCGQTCMPDATKQLNVKHPHEKQATPLSYRIFSFTMPRPNFHPVNLQQTSFKQ